MGIPVQYQQVQVKQLLHDPKEYDAWGLNKRIPEPGDTGTLIDVLHAQDLPDHYVVEKTSLEGGTIWLCEFLEEELEPRTCEES
jgi:hypothetical protein